METYDLMSPIYKSDDYIFHKILLVRNILAKYFFKRPEVQESFIRLLESNLDVIKCEYIPEQQMYVVKIKKTSIRKMPNYRPEASFYYNILGDIVRNLLAMHKTLVLTCFSTEIDKIASLYPNEFIIRVPYLLYDDIMLNHIVLSNLMNIQCVSDNIIQIIT